MSTNYETLLMSSHHTSSLLGTDPVDLLITKKGSEDCNP
jgi:hypothetical protein